jgi:hypothetical protein
VGSIKPFSEKRNLIKVKNMKEQIIQILEKYENLSTDQNITDLYFENIAKEILDLQLQQTAISRFYGVYSPKDDLLKVCKTKKRAMYERSIYEKQHGDGFYIDRVLIYP